MAKAKIKTKPYRLRGTPEPAQNSLGVTLSRIGALVNNTFMTGTQSFDRSDIICSWITSSKNSYARGIENAAEQCLDDITPLEGLTVAELAEKLIDSMKDGFHILDNHGIHLKVNAALCRMTGFTQEELVGTEPPYPYWPKDEYQNIQKAFEKTLRGEFEDFELVLKRKNGERFPVIVSPSWIKDEHGNVISYFATIKDITEAKRAREKLQRNEELYRTLVQTIPDGVQEIDKSGHITFANKSFHKIYGYAEGELLGKKIFDLAASRAERARLRKYIKAVRQGQLLPIPYESKNLTKDGRVIDVQVNWDYKRDELGHVTGLISIVTDITNRKRAEDALLRERNNLMSILDTMQDGVYIVDRQYNVQYINPCLKKDFGCYEGRKCYEYFHGRADACPSCRNQDVFAGRSLCWEWYSPTSKKTYDMIAAPLKNADGSISKLGIFHDITERKEAELWHELVEKILLCLNRKRVRLDVIYDVLELIKKSTGFEALGIRLREGDDFPYFAVNGFSAEFVEATNYLHLPDQGGNSFSGVKAKFPVGSICGRIMSGEVDSELPFFTKGGSFWTNSTTELLKANPLQDIRVLVRGRCQEAGYESVALVPLRSGNEIVGLLQFADSRPERFTPKMIRFFEQIGASMGIALARIRAEEWAENLAKFPSESPFPILRISKDGTLLYANAPGMSLLGQWNCQVGACAPENWRRLIAGVLDANHNNIMEVRHNGNTFSFVLAPVVEAGYVNVYGYDITEHRKAEQEILRLNEELEQRVAERTARLTRAHKLLIKEVEERKCLEKELSGVSEREKRLLGQELHDSLGQQLTGIALMAKILERKLAGLPNEAADAAEITKLVNLAVNQARGLARGLHPVGLDAEHLKSALKELTVTSEQLFGINCSFRAHKRVVIDDAAAANHLYRIAQEAITNAVKHGAAKNVRASLAYGKSKSVLTVESDGLDFPEGRVGGNGMGLKIMEHRAEMIGGSIDVRKNINGGTIVTCVFPSKKY